MKNKIKDYIDLIFADAPDCQRTREIKNEMYANVCDRYDELLREGKNEAEAYNASIAGIGDISELIDSIKSEHGERGGEYSDPHATDEHAQRCFTDEEKEEIGKYRARSSVMNSIAVSLYSTCWVPLVIISVLFAKFGDNSELGGAIGFALMMLFIATATVLKRLTSSTKPSCLKEINQSGLDGEKIRKA